jgi:hypothetical protein
VYTYEWSINNKTTCACLDKKFTGEGGALPFFDVDGGGLFQDSLSVCLSLSLSLSLSLVDIIITHGASLNYITPAD